MSLLRQVLASFFPTDRLTSACAQAYPAAEHLCSGKIMALMVHKNRASY